LFTRWGERKYILSIGVVGFSTSITWPCWESALNFYERWERRDTNSGGI
jgi:hypothetical protein